MFPDHIAIIAIFTGLYGNESMRGRKKEVTKDFFNFTIGQLNFQRLMQVLEY